MSPSCICAICFFIKEPFWKVRCIEVEFSTQYVIGQRKTRLRLEERNWFLVLVCMFDFQWLHQHVTGFFDLQILRKFR